VYAARAHDWFGDEKPTVSVESTTVKSATQKRLIVTGAELAWGCRTHWEPAKAAEYFSGTRRGALLKLGQRIQAEIDALEQKIAGRRNLLAAVEETLAAKEANNG
jgi:hypothetical protein